MYYLHVQNMYMYVDTYEHVHVDYLHVQNMYMYVDTMHAKMLILKHKIHVHVLVQENKPPQMWNTCTFTCSCTMHVMYISTCNKCTNV